MAINIGPLKLHREGDVIIPISINLIILLILGGWLIHPILGTLLLVGGIILGGLIIHFFRNPDIKTTQGDELIISPCDGKVVVIEEIFDETYFKDQRIQLSIFMSPLDVHVNRNPISGKVIYYKYFPGKYLMAFNPKSSSLNEQNLVVVKNDRLTVGYKQIAGFMARRIRTYLQEQQEVEQGAEYGFIKFGSRVDLILPLNCEIAVQLGQKVKAGVSVIAKASHSEAITSDSKWEVEQRV